MKNFNPHALRLVMARRKVSACQLANSLEIELPSLRKILVAQKKPTKKQIAAISKILKWPQEFFFNEKIRWNNEVWVSGLVVKVPYWPC